MASDAPTLINTDFATAIQRNKDNTLLLFAFLVVIAGVFGYVVGWAGGITHDIWTMPAAKVSHLTADWVVRDLFSLPPRTPALIGALGMMAAGALWGFVTLFLGAHILAAFVGARDANPALPAEQRFVNVVEEMAIAAGLPPPRAMIVDTPALNAFASGASPASAVITITRGLLQACSRDELQGVIGHEMGHIVDYDIRYSTVATAMAGVIVLVAHALRDLGRRLWAPRDADEVGGGAGPWRLALTLVVVAVLSVAIIVAPIAARLVQLAISRQREYLADATSVKLTRNPTGLIEALQRLQSGDTTIARAGSPVATLCIAAPDALSFGDIFSTHPPIGERIARLRNLGGVADTHPAEDTAEDGGARVIGSSIA
jgi:heat shock protein HtpX